jgi:hypothetical protein
MTAAGDPVDSAVGVAAAGVGVELEMVEGLVAAVVVDGAAALVDVGLLIALGIGNRVAVPDAMLARVTVNEGSGEAIDSGTIREDMEVGEGSGGSVGWADAVAVNVCARIAIEVFVVSGAGVPEGATAADATLGTKSGVPAASTV